MSSARYEILQRLDDGRNCFLGVCAGGIEAALTQPLTYVKNSLQQGVRVRLDPRIVYRGTGASCLADGTLIGTQFVVCGSLQKQLAGPTTRQLSFWEEMCCALASGAASGPPCCVLELTMIQQQRFGGSAADTLRRILAAGSLWRGLGPSSAREAFFAAGYLGLSPQLERLFDSDSSAATAASSLLSGLVCAALTHPIDTVKSCMQGDLLAEKYRGSFHTARYHLARLRTDRLLSRLPCSRLHGLPLLLYLQRDQAPARPRPLR